jgi:hypothetical protein
MIASRSSLLITPTLLYPPFFPDFGNFYADSNGSETRAWQPQ